VPGSARPRPGSPPPTRPGSLSATPADVRLEPGDEAELRIDLDLPGAPRPLDAYFLLDTSGSMDSAIEGLACSLHALAAGLTAAGVDAHFGLGEFYDSGYPRKRKLVDIGPPGRELQDTLRRISTRGGEESHRSALFQTATGEGLWTPGGRILVARDQDASYRDDAVRTVLMITDEPFLETTQHEPSVQEVNAALRARSIKHIGLQILEVGTAAPAGANRQQGLAQQVPLRLQMEEFSRGSGALAPPEGIDCDGTGVVDVREGEPIVCSLPRGDLQDQLTDVLRTVLLAIGDERALQLRLITPPEVSATVVDAERRVDTTEDQQVRWAASITCSAPVQEVAVTAEAVLGQAVVATADLTIACGDLPPPPSSVEAPTPTAVSAPVPADPVAVAAGPVPPPPPAPVPVTAQAPASAGASASASASANAGASASASAAAAQAGTAAQASSGSATAAAAHTAPAAASAPGTMPGLAGAHEQEVRLQHAHVRAQSQAPPELLFTALPSRPRHPLPLPTLVSGAAMALAVGLALRRRRDDHTAASPTLVHWRNR
jgi:hypothetical protein